MNYEVLIVANERNLRGEQRWHKPVNGSIVNFRL